VTIQLKNKANNEPMTMTLDFSDFGEGIKIEPPNL
jgi:hypothetical protein